MRPPYGVRREDGGRVPRAPTGMIWSPWTWQPAAGKVAVAACTSEEVGGAVCRLLPVAALVDFAVPRLQKLLDADTGVGPALGPYVGPDLGPDAGPGTGVGAHASG
ncbi:hypothetical protein ACIQV3_00995 [Streptomyces sp. NPDC099050]|uniref:hypothetical protein n=1 Tax=Streptomyces sp. NPDC099050 TaxID=3366100 RepID=UPI003807A535